ncbi:MAG: DUF86 domain-containing protein [Oscillatoriaceae cyanobacterium]
MRLEVKKYLFDIQESCQLIAEFTDGKDFAEYTSNAMLRSAVERQFEIIGEALNQMLKIEPSLASIITDTRKIIDFRNLLIHGYSKISNQVVWGILEYNLPILYREVCDLLKNDL